LSVLLVLKSFHARPSLVANASHLGQESCFFFLGQFWHEKAFSIFFSKYAFPYLHLAWPKEQCLLHPGQVSFAREFIELLLCEVYLEQINLTLFSEVSNRISERISVSYDPVDG